MFVQHSEYVPTSTPFGRQYPFPINTRLYRQRCIERSKNKRNVDISDGKKKKKRMMMKKKMKNFVWPIFQAFNPLFNFTNLFSSPNILKIFQLNTTLNLLTFDEQTSHNMSPIITVCCLLLRHEGKCTDATGMLVVKKCLSTLRSIAKHTQATTNIPWLVLGNAIASIKSSDYTINQLKKTLLDTITALTKRQQSGLSRAQAIPNPWA